MHAKPIFNRICWQKKSSYLNEITRSSNMVQLFFLCCWKILPAATDNMCKNRILIINKTKISNTVCYKELLGVDIHTPSWMSKPGLGYPRPGMDIIFFPMSTPGRGYPPPSVDVHPCAWISTPRRGCPRPHVDIILFLGKIMSRPGRGHPRPGVDIHAGAWISMLREFFITDWNML